MKCRYGNNCKFGGEVSKNEAVKDGSAYYHKECLKEKRLKQEMEQYYIDNMPPTTLAMLRKVIKQLLSNNKDAEYILFIMKYIKNNNKPINNPFGLINYCNDVRLEKEFNKIITNRNFKQIKNEIIENKDENNVTFTYNQNINNNMKII